MFLTDALTFAIAAGTVRLFRACPVLFTFCDTFSEWPLPPRHPILWRSATRLSHRRLRLRFWNVDLVCRSDLVATRVRDPVMVCWEIEIPEDDFDDKKIQVLGCLETFASLPENSAVMFAVKPLATPDPTVRGLEVVLTYLQSGDLIAHFDAAGSGGILTGINDNKSLMRCWARFNFDAEEIPSEAVEGSIRSAVTFSDSDELFVRRAFAGYAIHPAVQLGYVYPE